MEEKKLCKDCEYLIKHRGNPYCEVAKRKMNPLYIVDDCCNFFKQRDGSAYQCSEG